MHNGIAPVLIPTSQNDTPRENKFMTWLMLGISIGGASSLYLFNKPDESLRTGITVLAPAPQPAIENIVPKVEAAAPQRPDRNYLGLNIDVAEALLPTEFTFAELKGAEFIINYGDGIEEPVRGLKASHTYLAGGLKTVVLKASFNGQVEVLQSKVIDVANPIEIDMAADAVDR